MHQVNRAADYLVLQLVSAGYYCLEPDNLDAPVIIAGKDQAGFVVVLDWCETPDQPVKASPLPRELAFMNLPTRHVRVSPGDASKSGRPLLAVTMDADLLAQLSIEKPGEFGILVQAYSQTA